MKLLRHTILFTTAVLLFMASCDKQEDIDRAYTDYRYDIVTYLGQNENGAVFEYLGHGDSAAVKLQSNVDVSKNVVVNHRVLLRYDFADDNTSATTRQVDVFGCSKIISDSARYTTAAVEDYPMHQIKLRSLWRTGEFINLHCQVEYTGASRTFMFVADSATMDADTVHCYLMHDLRGQQATFWRDCYASFNMGNLWKRSSCKCLRVHVNDVTFPDTEFYDFTKQ